jgi:2-dehydro-3-deoxyphosphooctonate aldolase (KDO 8-P synthase)
LAREIAVGTAVAGSSRLLLIAGPCVIENEDVTFSTAEALMTICTALGISFVFKSSFDKANRTSIGSFRGPGIEKGLRILSDVRSKFGVPVISDVHTAQEVQPASQALDGLQIPAFLCRQTDILIAAAKTGRPVNIKKGQFLAPWDMKNVIEKFTSTGNHNLLITERGVSFGYNNLVVDFRSFPIMRSFGYPVVFDVTHSLQLPGGRGSSSGGQREFAAPLARAAAAAGIDGLFMEVHPDPDRALCDGPNMVRLETIHAFLKDIKAIHDVVTGQATHGSARGSCNDV